MPSFYGDRFISRRYALSRASRFKAESKPDQNTDPMVMKEMPGYWRTHQYSAVLQDLFGLVPARDRILSFQDSNSSQECFRLAMRRPLDWIVQSTYQNQQKLDWSCHPRTKPTGFIEAVHDLPNIKSHYHKIIDWSSAGQIAAIFNKKLVIWTPTSDVMVGMRARDTTSIAFNPSGDRLAIAIFMMNRPWLDIMEVSESPLVRHGALKMLDPLDQPISYLTWDGSGQYVVCGFGNGQISIVHVRPIFSKVPERVDSKYYAHQSTIIAIKFSCGSRYMATADDLGQLYIWYWNGGHLAPITRWNSSMCAFFDWHPWREDEIVIADSEPITIALYHVQSCRVVSYYAREERDCIATTLSFNKISGELVVCFSFTDASKPPEILVLASMDRVVDVMSNHEDIITYLLWSPDGQQLASIGYDETLTIWNFFGKSLSNKKRKAQSEPTSTGGGSGSDSTGSSRSGGPATSSSKTRIQCNRNKEATYRDLASSFLFKAMR
uniref:WD repeat-containing protein 55 homolog n=1 Tax=Anopheles farauti TaxID=69004 RepID=A0A182Q7U8_9DIPT